MRRGRWGIALVLAVTLGTVRASAADPVVVDTFEVPDGWSASTSPGSRAQIAWEQEPDGGSTALRFDFDLARAGGFVILRKEVTLPLPENFAFTFRLRGEVGRASFEFKVVDGTGKNVWWRRWKDYPFSTSWQTVTVRRSRLAFAWGPSDGTGPASAGALEIAVGAGEGGLGTIWIDDLQMEPRPAALPDEVTPAVTASSTRAGQSAAHVLDDTAATRWHSDATDDPQWLVVDFGHPREFGGIVVDWDPVDYATAYDAQVSDDGVTWRTVHHTTTATGGRDYLYVPDAEARFVRFDLQRSSRGRGFAIGHVAFKPVDFSESPNAFFSALAADAPPGTWPKYLTGHQTYWTVVGVDADGHEALVNEEGMVEVDRAFSLEPFVYHRGRLVTWADVAITQELTDGALPVPTVVWRRGNLRLRVTAFASGEPGNAMLNLRYRLDNVGGLRVQPRLFLAVRPLQVLPPWQSLNIQGGVTQIRELRWDGHALWVDRTRPILPIVPPDSAGAATFEEGAIASFLMLGRTPEAAAVSDPFGFASGALGWSFRLSPGDTGEAAVTVPLHRVALDEEALVAPAAASLPALQTVTENRWRDALGDVEITLPPSETPILQTLRSTIAYMLVNRDGPQLRPGSRNYARAWIRDGAMMSESLLQMGLPQPVAEFARWYATQQGRDGRVPCCVDARGPDWTPENDSEGAFIYTVAEYWRYTRDPAFLQELWPHVDRAVERIAALRAERMTAAYRTPERRAYWGILPESISHEGYSGHPVHAYWDDFFALRGLKDAVTLARAAGHEDRADEIATLRDEFRASVLASLQATMADHALDVLPGSVELGDFDPTSSSIAIVPGGELAHLPADAVRNTYERYWAEIEERFRGAWGGMAYSPYELRNVGVFVRLGWRERAHRLLDLFMPDRRPLPWNEWAEVVWKDRDLPRFIGDMPHTWVGAGFVQAVRSMIAYEREADAALVVGAGLVPAWLAGDGVRVRRLPTHHGRLDLDARREGPDVVHVRVAGDVVPPPGGIVVHGPLDQPVVLATVNGEPVAVEADGTVRLHAVPADVLLRAAPEQLE